jgi:dTDP-glucose pyrophosphorylase
MNTPALDKAVILARGLGTRMRKADDGAALTAAQAAAAAAGAKALMPIDRPFLDYVLSGLADAGYRRICLIVGPGPNPVREHYSRLKTRRIQLDFAVQVEPRGTADAVAAAEAFADGDPVLVINSDNYYPADALAGLAKLAGMGAAVFARRAMLAESNIAPERIEKFAVVALDAAGNLKRIVEKPDAAALAALPEPVYVSMNCWRFAPAIFEACRAIKPSPRGELEITDAVQYAIDTLGEPFRVLCYDSAVLDMSSRADVPAVAARLKGTEVRL